MILLKLICHRGIYENNIKETTLKEKLEDMAQDTSEKTNFSNPTFKL